MFGRKKNEDKKVVEVLKSFGFEEKVSFSSEALKNSGGNRIRNFKYERKSVENIPLLKFDMWSFGGKNNIMIVPSGLGKGNEDNQKFIFDEIKIPDADIANVIENYCRRTLLN